MSVIDTTYTHIPTAFSNGLGDMRVINGEQENQGSCKILAFGQMHGLNQEETLACFGEHYRHVLDHPDETSHANIRAFMAHGWQGVRIEGKALSPRTN